MGLRQELVCGVSASLSHPHAHECALRGREIAEALPTSPWLCPISKPRLVKAKTDQTFGFDFVVLTLMSLVAAEERKFRRKKGRRMFERSEFGAPRLN